MPSESQFWETTILDSKRIIIKAKAHTIYIKPTLCIIACLHFNLQQSGIARKTITIAVAQQLCITSYLLPTSSK